MANEKHKYRFRVGAFGKVILQVSCLHHSIVYWRDATVEDITEFNFNLPNILS